MAQDVGGLVGLEHEVDRHQHRAQPGERKAQRRKAVRVARQQGVELGIGPGGKATDDGRLCRQPQGAAAQGIGNRLASNRGVHGVSVFFGETQCLYNLPALAVKAWPAGRQCLELRQVSVQFVTN
jgi:hypothetical protein